MHIHSEFIHVAKKNSQGHNEMLYFAQPGDQSLMMLRLICAVSACCFLASGQGSIESHLGFKHPLNDLPASLLRVDSSTVVIPVHATSRLGNSVIDLKREDFQLFDEGHPQDISYFAKDDTPVSIGILFDASGSMQKKMPKAREAVSRFMTMANRSDEFFLVEFNERPKLALPFTDDAGEIEQKVNSVRPVGRTSLYDAIFLALAHMKKAKYGKKALVVFSDGGDNRSRHSFRSIKNLLLESDVQLFAIGIYPSNTEEQAKTSEEIKGPGLLEELTTITGGRHFAVDKIGDLPAVSERVSLEIRSQYVLGYSPKQFERDGRFHRVKVDVSTTDLSLRYRHGYYAPIE